MRLGAASDLGLGPYKSSQVVRCCDYRVLASWSASDHALLGAGGGRSRSQRPAVDQPFQEQVEIYEVHRRYVLPQTKMAGHLSGFRQRFTDWLPLEGPAAETVRALDSRSHGQSRRPRAAGLH